MNESSNGKGFSVSLFVNNKPGVLVRIAQTFARRGYNIDSLVVSNAHDARFSRITVVFQGDHENVDQILRQLNKLIDVVHAIQHGSETSVDREMALFKVGVKPEKRTEVFQIIDVFRAKTVDITDESIIIETTGSSSKIDALERMLSSVGLLEMVRSGKLMMARGLEPTLIPPGSSVTFPELNQSTFLQISANSVACRLPQVQLPGNNEQFPLCR